jgi:hypothetical protein
MNDNPPAADSDMLTVTRAIRFGFAAIVLGMSYANICLASNIHYAEQIFRDMLNGKPLPAIPVFVIHAQPLFFTLSLCIPIAAIALIFVRRLALSFYGFGALILILFIQFFSTWRALSAPFMSIVTQMQGG